ncbi:MAG TPA: hypothetical protein VFF64_00615 [Candidatus Eremiobacteraceae bacterium]|nr:hypothetical protein [Candidatus Eremiobacteraceae bacterium]
MAPQLWTGSVPSKTKEIAGKKLYGLAVFVDLLAPRTSAIVFLAMFEDFTAIDRWTKKPVHCVYQALIVAIATRHADAVDIKFLVDGRTVWVALPHPAWVEYKKRTGKLITDSLAVEIAGHYLKSAMESGEGLGREMYSLTVAETLAHLEAVVSELQATALA